MMETFLPLIRDVVLPVLGQRSSPCATIPLLERMMSCLEKGVPFELDPTEEKAANVLKSAIHIDLLELELNSQGEPINAAFALGLLRGIRANALKEVETGVAYRKQKPSTKGTVSRKKKRAKPNKKQSKNSRPKSNQGAGNGFGA